MSSKKIFINFERCDNCQSCVVSCFAKMIVEPEMAKKSGSIPTLPIFIAQTNEGAFPVICRHCEDAPCVEACISSALKKEDDLILHDRQKCVGCWMCVMVCPFGAIFPDYENKKAVKCLGCTEENVPPCVESCKNDALVYCEIEDKTSNNRKSSAEFFYSQKSYRSTTLKKFV